MDMVRGSAEAVQAIDHRLGVKVCLAETVLPRLRGVTTSSKTFGFDMTNQASAICWVRHVTSTATHAFNCSLQNLPRRYVTFIWLSHTKHVLLYSVNSSEDGMPRA
jgi:hypothetical protein